MSDTAANVQHVWDSRPIGGGLQALSMHEGTLTSAVLPDSWTAEGWQLAVNGVPVHSMNRPIRPGDFLQPYHGGQPYSVVPQGFVLAVCPALAVLAWPAWLREGGLPMTTFSTLFPRIAEVFRACRRVMGAFFREAGFASVLGPLHGTINLHFPNPAIPAIHEVADLLTGLDHPPPWADVLKAAVFWPETAIFTTSARDVAGQTVLLPAPSHAEHHLVVIVPPNAGLIDGLPGDTVAQLMPRRSLTSGDVLYFVRDPGRAPEPDTDIEEEFAVLLQTKAQRQPSRSHHRPCCVPTPFGRRQVPRAAPDPATEPFSAKAPVVRQVSQPPVALDAAAAPVSTSAVCQDTVLVPTSLISHARRFPVSLAASLEGDSPEKVSSIAEAAQTLESLWGSCAPGLCLLGPSAPVKRPGRLLLEQSTWVPWDHLPAGPREVFVYTDGSQKGTSGAGAAVVFTQGDQRQWLYHGAILIRADDWLQQWDCAPTSTSMESCALCAALCWALRLERGSQCHLLSDGLTSLQAMQGYWAIPASSAGDTCRFAASSRVLFRLGETLGLDWHPLHTPGHSGHAGNELADAFARSALQGETSPGWGEVLGSIFRSKVRDWLWMLPRGTQSSCLPTVWDIFWGHAARSVSEQVRESVVTQLPAHVGPDLGPCQYTVCTTVGTFNAQTLRSAGSLDVLLHELRDQRCSVLGVQEVRFSDARSFEIGHHIVITSACTEQGQQGCALILSKEVPYAWAGPKALFFDSRQVFVVISEPSILIVKISAPGLQMLCVVAHAPHCSRSDQERTMWWSRLQAHIHTGSADPRHTPVLLIDANARVGEEPSELIGDHQAEEPNRNTPFFIDLLHHFAWSLPATTPIHTGEGYTWTSPSGHHQRIDFVAVPAYLATSVQASWGFDVPLPREHDDHRATVVRWAFSKSMPRTRARHGPRCHIPAHEAKALQADIMHLPPVAWHEGLDAHAGCLARQYQCVLKRRSQPTASTPREPYVDAQALMLISRKKELKQELRGAEEDARAPLRLLFQSCARDLRRCLRANKVKYLEGLADRFKEAASGSCVRQLYEAIRPFRARGQKRARFRVLTGLVDGDGRPVASPSKAQEIWESHFGDNEGGRCCSPQELLQAHRASVAGATTHTQVPTLLEWETTFRGLKSRKAPGWDGLSTDHLRMALPQFTQLTYPLALKAACTGAEPLRWRGGQAIPLYKGKGDPARPSNHRSILISELLGKRYHCWIRRSLMQAFETRRLPLHAGMGGGISTSILSLTLRAFQSHMREKHASYGILFLDLKSAFYTVVRTFVTGVCTAKNFQDWVSRQQLDPEIAALIFRTLQRHSPDSFPWGGFQHRLHSLLEATWFHVPGSDRYVTTSKGTKPGDPLADMLFALVLHPTLLDLEEQIRTLGYAAELHLGGILGPDSDTSTSFVTGAWHDDVAICIQAPSAEDLRPAATQVSRLVLQAFTAKGLKLSFEPGKTEWMLVPQGRGHRQAQITLLEGRSSCIAALPDIGPGAVIGVTLEYKHLGSIICSDSSLRPDIRRRIGEAATVAKELRKRVFAHPSVALRTRCCLFRSLVLSRATHNIGAWATLSQKEGLMWQGGLLRLYKALLVGVQHDSRLTQTEICDRAHMPAPLHVLSIERLRLLGQLSRAAAAPTLHVLEAGIGSKRCWLEAVLRDASWAATLLPRHLPQAWVCDPDIEAIFAWARLQPRAYSRAVGKLWNVAAELPAAQRHLLQVHSPTPASLACPLCPFQAACRTGLSGHLSHCHGARSLTRRLLDGTVCSVCCVDFRTRTRALRHLRKRSACFHALRQKGQYLPKEVADSLDAQELLRHRTSRGRNREDLCPACPSSYAGTDVWVDAAQAGLDSEIFLEDLLPSI